MTTLFSAASALSPLAAGAAVLLLSLVAGALQLSSPAKADAAPQRPESRATSAPDGPGDRVHGWPRATTATCSSLGVGDHAGCSLLRTCSRRISCSADRPPTSPVERRRMRIRALPPLTRFWPQWPGLPASGSVPGTRSPRGAGDRVSRTDSPMSPSRKNPPVQRLDLFIGDLLDGL